MATNERDVSLVIKAKNEAKSAIDSVADALRELNDVQQDVGASANKADGLMGKLKGALLQLDKQARSLNAFGKIAASLTSATDAVGRLDAKTKNLVDTEDRLLAQLDAAGAKTAAARSAVEVLTQARDRQREAVNKLTADERKNSDAGARQVKLRDQLNKAVTNSTKAFNQAEAAEKKLAEAFDASARATQAHQYALIEANAELSQIAAIANQASSALGGVEATQLAIANASQKAATDMAKLNAAMKQSGGLNSVAVPDTAAARRDVYKNQIAEAGRLKVAWRDAQAEANALAAKIKSAEEPTLELKNAFVLAQAASKAAKHEYYAQGQALNDYRNKLVALRKTAASPAAPAIEPIPATVVPPQLPRNLKQTADNAFRLRDAFSSVYGESRQAMNLFQRLRGEVLSLASAYVGLYAAIGGLGGVVKAYQTLEAAQSRLGTVFSQNTQRVGIELQFIREEAARLGIAFSTLSDEYGKFAFAASAANLTNAETRKIFLSVAESARVMKLSQEDLSGVFRALTQIMSKGKVQAEELRGQLGDRMSGAFQLFASAIGVSTAELDKMMESGEVLANRSNLLKFADELGRRFGPQLAEALKSTTSQIGFFQNNLEKAQLQVAQGGFIEGFTAALVELNKWFDSSDGEDFFLSLGAALGKVASIVPALIKNIDLLVFGLQTMAALKLSQVMIGLMGGMQGLSISSAKATGDVARLTIGLYAMGQASSSPIIRGGLTGLSTMLFTFRGAAIAAATAARTLWVALGGLPGLIITAATLAISALAGNWLTAVDKATEALSKHEARLLKIQSAYVSAGGKAEEWTKKLSESGVGALEAQQGVNDLSEALRKNEQRMGVMNLKLRDLARYYPAISAELQKVTAEYNAGTISSDEYIKSLNLIGDKLPVNEKRFRGMLMEMEKTTREGEFLKKALIQAGAAYDLVTGKIKGTTIAQLGLNDALKETSALTGSAVEGYNKYVDTLKTLRNYNPTNKINNDALDEIAKIRKAYDDAMSNPVISNNAKLVAALERETNAAINEVKKKQAADLKRDGKVKLTPEETAAQRQAKAQKEFNEDLARAVEMRQFEIDQLTRIKREQYIMAEIQSARMTALDKELTLSGEQEKLIRESAGAEFDATQALEVNEAIRKAQLDLLKAQGKEESKNAFLMREMNVLTLEGLTSEQEAWAKVLGLIYDVTAAKVAQDKAVNAADLSVTNLQAQQKALQDQIEFYKDQGQTGIVGALKEQLKGVNQELIGALDSALAVYRALDPATNPSAAAAIINLEQLRLQTTALGQEFVFTAGQIDQMLADNLSSTWDTFMQKVADGQSAFKAFGESLMESIANFAAQIGQAILQYQLLQLLTKYSPGGYLAKVLNGTGLIAGATAIGTAGTTAATAITGSATAIATAGGVAAAAITAAAAALAAASSSGSTASSISAIISSVAHTGGVIGSTNLESRSVWAGHFANAVRYHTGGVIGLKPNEIPIIAEKGEEMLTADDPRHRNNASRAPAIKIVNGIDSGSFVSEGMKTDDGETAVLNLMSRNKDKIRGMLGFA